MKRFIGNKRFKVDKAKLLIEDGKQLDYWIITDNLLPNFEINQWIDNKSIRKVSTGKEYANKLVVFLNFLDRSNKSFKEVKAKDIESFFKYLIYGDSLDLNIQSLDGRLSYSTFQKYSTVIKEFYKWYDGANEYAHIWNHDYESFIKIHIHKLNGKREYKKWYTEKEKEVIISNLKTLRDKALFLMTLEGFRIDEGLSMKLKNYDSYNRLIKPTRSKGKPNATTKNNLLRTIALPVSTCEVIDRYINTERVTAEYESGILSEYIFLNLKKGVNQGQPLSYRNYYEILKRAAKRGNMDPEKIRTHSGRSTKAMEMIEHQIEYPEDGITDLIIMEQFGWKSLNSIEPYKNHNNEAVAKKVLERIQGRKFNNSED